MRLCYALLTLSLIVAPCLYAAEVELVYHGSNRWVAPEDNAPLRTLLKAAKNGTRHYTVALPAANRSLSIARLEVLQQLLAKSSGGSVVMVEQGAEPGTNRLRVGY